jgi:hypothetical protein
MRPLSLGDERTQMPLSEPVFKKIIKKNYAPMELPQWATMILKK